MQKEKKAMQRIPWWPLNTIITTTPKGQKPANFPSALHIRARGTVADIYIYIQGCANSPPQRLGASNMYQKSLKNHPKIHHKSTKIHEKSTKSQLKSALGPQEAPRPTQDPSKPKNRSNLFPPRGPFWKAFGAMFASKSY